MKSEFAEAFGARADSQAMLKNYEGAIDDYTNAISLNMNNAAFYNNRGQLFVGRGAYEQAYKDHNHAIELDGTQGLYYLNRGRDQIYLGEHKECVSDCTEALEKGYPNCEPLYYQAKSYLALQDDRAKDDLQTFVQRVVGNGTPDEIDLLKDA